MAELGTVPWVGLLVNFPLTSSCQGRHAKVVRYGPPELGEKSSDFSLFPWWFAGHLLVNWWLVAGVRTPSVTNDSSLW